MCLCMDMVSSVGTTFFNFQIRNACAQIVKRAQVVHVSLMFSCSPQIILSKENEPVTSSSIGYVPNYTIPPPPPLPQA